MTQLLHHRTEPQICTACNRETWSKRWDEDGLCSRCRPTLVSLRKTRNGKLNRDKPAGRRNGDKANIGFQHLAIFVNGTRRAMIWSSRAAAKALVEKAGELLAKHGTRATFVIKGTRLKD